jgi:hypothetical protein
MLDGTQDQFESGGEENDPHPWVQSNPDLPSRTGQPTEQFRLNRRYIYNPEVNIYNTAYKFTIRMCMSILKSYLNPSLYMILQDFPRSFNSEFCLRRSGQETGVSREKM